MREEEEELTSTLPLRHILTMMKNMKKRSKKSKRTKTKKPKFVSLVQLPPEKPQHPPSETNTGNQNLELNLFPLEPDHDHDHQNMAYLFSGGDGDGGATSITNLLGSATITSSDTDNNVNTALSSSDNYAYCGARAELVRTALRNCKGREESEERWVFYSEVVEKRSDEEVSSCCNAAEHNQRINNGSVKLKGLALKLDYTEIMDAWADMGPLYIDSEMVVPDNATYQDILSNDSTSIGLENEGRAYDICRVPEIALNERTSNGSSTSSFKPEEQVPLNSCCWKMQGQREASLRRYKEKRQNRLYAKRTRYQVRKLNAEKRPRLKGRFVKRC